MDRKAEHIALVARWRTRIGVYVNAHTVSEEDAALVLSLPVRRASSDGRMRGLARPRTRYTYRTAPVRTYTVSPAAARMIVRARKAARGVNDLRALDAYSRRTCNYTHAHGTDA